MAIRLTNRKPYDRILLQHILIAERSTMPICTLYLLLAEMCCNIMERTVGMRSVMERIFIWRNQ